MTAPADVPFYAVNPGISLGEAIHESRRAHRCTCSRENGTCPRHEAEIEAAEWHGGDYDADPPFGGFDPDFHFPRDLAPRGL